MATAAAMPARAFDPLIEAYAAALWRDCQPAPITDPARLLPPVSREDLFLDPHNDAIHRFAAAAALHVRLGLDEYAQARLVALERQYGWAANNTVREVPCS